MSSPIQADLTQEFVSLSERFRRTVISSDPPPVPGESLIREDVDPSYYQSAIPAVLRDIGIDVQSPDVAVALGYILHQRNDPEILANLHSQLSEFAIQGPYMAHRNFEGFQKSTWMIAALALPHDSVLRIAALPHAFDRTDVLYTDSIENRGVPHTQENSIPIPELDRGQIKKHYEDIYGHATDSQRSPGLNAVLSNGLEDMSRRVAESLESHLLDPESIRFAEDPVLVNSLIGLNQALLQSYQTRQFRGEQPDACARSAPEGWRGVECRYQFAAATGATAGRYDEPATPRQKLGWHLRFRSDSEDILKLATEAILQRLDEKINRSESAPKPPDPVDTDFPESPDSPDAFDDIPPLSSPASIPARGALTR